MGFDSLNDRADLGSRHQDSLHPALTEINDWRSNAAPGAQKKVVHDGQLHMTDAFGSSGTSNHQNRFPGKGEEQPESSRKPKNPMPAELSWDGPSDDQRFSDKSSQKNGHKRTECPGTADGADDAKHTIDLAQPTLEPDKAAAPSELSKLPGALDAKRAASDATSVSKPSQELAPPLEPQSPEPVASGTEGPTMPPLSEVAPPLPPMTLPPDLKAH